MTDAETIRAYQSLALDEQARFLARFAQCLTVRARGTYVAGSSDVSDPARLRGFNEALHRIAGQLSHLLERDPARYPDDAFAEMLSAAAREAGCERDLARLLLGAKEKPVQQTA
jgi:hypothetical protein